MQTNNILILANNNFASTKKDAIRSAKIITKDKKHLTPTHSLKFNRAQIKLDLNRIVITKKSHVRGILLITDHIADSISLKEIIRKKLSPKKQY